MISKILYVYRNIEERSERTHRIVNRGSEGRGEGRRGASDLNFIYFGV